MKKLAILASLSCFLPALGHAQTSDPFWRSWQALDDVTEARAAGFAGAVAAIADDASTARYNPAGLTRLPKQEIGASLMYRGADTRPNGDELMSATTLGAAAASLSLSTRWAIGEYVAQSAHQYLDWPTGTLEMSTLDAGLGIAWHPTERVHLGTRAVFRQLDVTGLAADHGLTIGTGGDADEWAADAGILVEITPELHGGVSYRRGVRWSDLSRTAVDASGATVDPGSLYQLALPSVVAGSLAWRPSPNWTVAAQIDYVALAAVHDTLGAADPENYELDDAIEPRVGVEYSHPVGSITMQLRGGFHYRASRAFTYVGPDLDTRAAWPGDDSALVGAGGASIATHAGHRLDLGVTFGGGRTTVPRWSDR